jgi:hypothetical protein
MKAAPSRLLESPRLPALIVLVATLLAATSLSGGRTLDDWVLAVVARGQGPALGLPSQRWDCFRFTTGNPIANQGLMDRGVLLPWWSARELKIAFFRPLSALTHQLDEAMWPNSPVALHAQSLLWFAALLVVVWKVYQRLTGERRLANLAFALYALDDAHGATVGWIANRNAMLSAAFGCACLWAHDRWRRGGSRLAGGLSLLLFALSCLAGELGAATLAYLIAYAFFLERSAVRERMRSLLGYVVWCTAWRAGWSWGGYGAQGSGAYVDPFTEPLGFMAAAPRKWLSLLQGQLGIIPADLAFVGSTADQRLWISTGLATLIAAAFLIRRGLDDRRGRFWLGGALLALLPMAASFPSDRLLLFVGLGAMPLLARAFLQAGDELFGAARLCAKITTSNVLALGFFAIHGLLAPLLLPLRAGQMGLMARAEQAAFQQLVASAGSRPKGVIVLNVPSLLLTNYAQLRLDARGSAPFSSLYVLSATDSAVDVTRTGAAELTLHADQGLLHTPLERHYRGSRASPFDHDRVSLAGLEADITASSPDGRPASVRFKLRRDVSDYVFECWSDGSFRRCELPALGETTRLAPADLGRILLDQRAKP